MDCVFAAQRCFSQAGLDRINFLVFVADIVDIAEQLQGLVVGRKTGLQAGLGGRLATALGHCFLIAIL